MNSGSLLVVPAVEKGCGGGHLVRSLALVCSLRSQNREAYLFFPFSDFSFFSNLKNSFSPAWLITDEKMLKSRDWDCIVLDRFKTPPEEFAQWSALAPVIGIDEGGSLRNRFDFLIDLLPGLPEAGVPNILAPSLLPLPRKRREEEPQDLDEKEEKEKKKILVSFGAEDPENLTVPVCLALISQEKDFSFSKKKSKKNSKREITALFGGLNRLEQGELLSQAGIRVLDHIPELREHLAEYDLVITHFGLTAFECIYARVPVILVSPGDYHEKLAVYAGFMSAGIGAAGAGRLRELVINDAFLKTLGTRGEQIGARYGLTARAEQSLGTLLGSYTPHFPSVCPACGDQDRFNHPVLARFPERTYRRCSRCSIVYMLRPVPPPIEYERDYFFDFYKKQYGKTYLEDFPNLIKNGKVRLARISAVLQTQVQPGETLRLLDIGCAYGPFLAAAQEEGFSPAGMDPAEDAVRYVQEELKIPAFRGFFPDTPLPDILQDSSFAVISLWYVLEHFENPGAVLQEICRLLKPGGVLAFSTPSFSGVSARTSVKGFLEKSPPDHWTVWEPRHTGKILKNCGFTLKKIVVSGHHPERFPLFGRFLSSNQGFLYRFCLWISRLFRLGDTFEVYAVKR